MSFIVAMIEDGPASAAVLAPIEPAEGRESIPIVGGSVSKEGGPLARCAAGVPASADSLGASVSRVQAETDAKQRRHPAIHAGFRAGPGPDTRISPGGTITAPQAAPAA